MIAMLGAVLAASAIGSLHCVAMCGPLVALHHRAGRASWRMVSLHHTGRLAAYVALGAIAGAIGSAIDLAGRAASVQRAAMIVAGVAIVAWGAVALRDAVGSRRDRQTPRVYNAVVIRIRRQPPARRAAIFGALTALLPCGWLWAFAIVAGGTASWWLGALVMAAFWLGTMPALVGVAAVFGPALAVLRSRMPVITAVLLIALGLGAIAIRVPLLAADDIPLCHRVAAPELR